MASRVRDPNGNYLVKFRYGGWGFTRSLETRDAGLADTGVKRAEKTLMRLKRGWLMMPPDADPVLFIVSGGQLSHKPVMGPRQATAVSDPRHTVKTTLDLYVGSLTPGAKGANTLETEAIPRTHLVSLLGAKAVETVGLADLDGYVKARAGSGRDAVTIRKELATLRMIWNWARKRAMSRHRGRGSSPTCRSRSRGKKSRSRRGPRSSGELLPAGWVPSGPRPSGNAST